MKKLIRSAYSKYPTVYNPVSGQPSRTKQEFKNEVNINEIVARMRRGINPPAWMTAATPRYGDFSDLPATLMEAHQIVERAEAAFASLPLEFRRALDHDPRNLDRAPKELFEQFGLLKPKKSAEGSAPDSSPQGDSSDAERGDNTAPKGATKKAPKADQKTDE